MADVTGQQITDIVNGGSANAGQDLYFIARLEGVNKAGEPAHLDSTFFMELARLPSFITALENFGAMAQRVQEKKAGPKKARHHGEYIGRVRAQDITGCTAGTDNVHNKVILELQKTDGMLIRLAFDRSTLREVDRALKAGIQELDRLESSERNPPH